MYKVEFTNYTSRFLDQCESQLRSRLFKKIEELSIEPFPQGCIKLQGNENLFRIRVGEHRVLYSLIDNSGNFVTSSPKFSNKPISKLGNPIKQIAYNNKILLIYKIDKRSRAYD
ncbi:hypothetical protein J4218_04620 [Candidatus Pacearchaeota archaeon]|nr:hypothetical protein [Candidatus Pacearchaeota archaeon]